MVSVRPLLQSVEAEPWKMGPWVVCGPRTPPLSPPVSQDSAATLTASESSLSPAPAPASLSAAPGAEGDDAAAPLPLAPGAVLRGAAASYEVLSTLGQGVYGQVRHAPPAGDPLDIRHLT